MSQIINKLGTTHVPPQQKVWFQKGSACRKSWRGVEYQGGREPCRELSQHELTNDLEEGQV